MIDFNKIGTTPEELRKALLELRGDFDSHNHDGYSSKKFESLTAETISARALLVRKTSINDDTSGFWVGLVNNVPSLYLGSTTSYLKFLSGNLSIKGSLTATSGQIGGTIITESELTGGIIQTSSSGDRLVMTDDSFASNGNPAIDCYDGSTCVGAIRPQINTAGKGMRMEAYRWLDGVERASISLGYGDDLGDLGGEASYLELSINEDIIFGAYNDQSLSGINYLTFNGTRIDGSIHPPTGTGSSNGDIGRSDSTWDNMWVEDINYQTLSDFSDIRLKKNVEDISYGLSEILRLRPVSFKWKKTNKNGSGFIAQEVKEIIPSIVKEAKQKEIEYTYTDKEVNEMKGNGEIIKKTKRVRSGKNVSSRKILPEGANESDEGLLMMEETKLIPILVKAIQELEARVKVLENKP